MWLLFKYCIKFYVNGSRLIVWQVMVWQILEKKQKQQLTHGDIMQYIICPLPSFLLGGGQFL